ncbi:hypothetical protein QTP88_013744 [Uroleucon formosanum]
MGETQSPVDQILTIQELHEKTPAGQSPRLVNVLLENDLVDKCKPGDRVMIVDKSDITICRQSLEKKKNTIFELLANSIAPTIQSYEREESCCMFIVGWRGNHITQQNMYSGYVLQVAPIAVGTTGVGLTAAVTTNKASGGCQLEAGAMVLADRGVVCIDKFEKMSDINRVTLDEAMEQGRVFISKVSIHAKLNARCSVLAAANPLGVNMIYIKL